MRQVFSWLKELGKEKIKYNLDFFCQDRKKLRLKGYKPKEPGDLVQMDSITKFVNGIKRYI